MADILISELPVISGVTLDDYIIINDGNVTTAIASFMDVVASITDVGVVGFADGTEAAPAVTFTNDRNVGIYRPNPDEWAVSTNAVQRLVIDNAGRIGISNYTPGNWNNGSNNLVIGSPVNGDNGITLVSGPTDVGTLAFSDSSESNDTRQEGRIQYDHTDNHMNFHTNHAEAFRITNEQDVLIGTTVPIVGSRVVVAGGAVSIPTGSPGVPSLNFATDTDTGVWSAAPDHVSIATGGLERGTIDDEGHIYLAADSDTYIYHSADDELAIVNQDQETLALDANNNLRLSGALPTLYTDRAAARINVNAFGTHSTGSALEFYLDGTERGRMTSQGLALNTVTPQGLMTIGGDGSTPGYPSVNLTRNTDASNTTDVAFSSSQGVIRGIGILSQIVNDDGSFTWGVGGNNVAAGVAGSTEYMSLNNTTLSVNADISTNANIILTGASAAGTFFSTPVANSVAISTTGVERFRVADGGAIGLSGANYGAPGQVLTSGGAGAAPTWTSISTGLPDISLLPPLP